jgi:hypothetical protein
MATTTPNFGWSVPTSTDLVKDGATAIETLGDSIDASLLDLKGGTSGQILSKNSNTDMDFVWIANDQGDITGVTAGTGISGGGTSGTVTVTNSMATAIDAKGDLIAGTGADAFSRLAVGTNGYVLTADSAEATGIKWAAAAGGSTYAGVSVGNTSGSVSIANGTYTAVNWATEDFDTDGYHSTSSNTSRITIPTGKAGKYQVGGFLLWDPNTSGMRVISIYKNGTEWKYTSMPSSNQYPITEITTVMNLAVADYIQVYVWQDSGSARDIFPYSTQAQFYASFLGA